jgi:hypothetical protein
VQGDGGGDRDWESSEAASARGRNISGSTDSRFHEAINEEEQERLLSDLLERWWTAGPSIEGLLIMEFLRRSAQRKQQQDLQSHQQIEQQRLQQQPLQQTRVFGRILAREVLSEAKKPC